MASHLILNKSPDFPMACIVPHELASLTSVTITLCLLHAAPATLSPILPLGDIKDTSTFSSLHLLFPLLGKALSRVIHRAHSSLN